MGNPSSVCRVQSCHHIKRMLYKWMIGMRHKVFLPPSCTLHLTTLVFVLSVCVNNLWISNFILGGLQDSLTQLYAFMLVAVEGSTNLQFFTKDGGYCLLKRLCAMRWVIGLQWIITMWKCSFADTLITSTALKKFKILSCVFVFLMCSPILS